MFCFAQEYQSDFWTSGTCFGTEREFYWMSTGQDISFSNWSPGEPNNAWERENCIEMWNEDGWRWNDALCEDKKGFICEDQI